MTKLGRPKALPFTIKAKLGDNLVIGTSQTLWSLILFAVLKLLKSPESFYLCGLHLLMVVFSILELETEKI